MKTLLLAAAAISTLSVAALSTTEASARHGGWHRSYRPHVTYVAPYANAAPSSCYRGQWVGGPKWRRYRRVKVCG